MKRRSSYLPGSFRERQEEFKSEVGLAVVAVCAALVAIAVLLISLGVVL